MPKSNILPIRKSPERLKDVRIKDANFNLVDLTKFQIGAIMERKNPVNGRYVAALNVKNQILEMYPSILTPTTAKAPEKVNQNLFMQPATAQPAPEVAPPPMPVQPIERPPVQPAETAMPVQATQEQQLQGAPTNVISIAEAAAKHEASSTPLPASAVRPDGTLDADAIRRLVEDAHMAGTARSDVQEQLDQRRDLSSQNDNGSFDDIMGRAA